MAAQRGLSPSAVVGIDCDTCAYFFDDALVFREWAATHREMKAVESQRDFENHSAATARMSQGLRR